MVNFNEYSFYYDQLYKDKDYQKESEYVKYKIFKYFGSKNQINLLELGIGSAKHAEYLVRDGFSITGIERSNTMIEIASGKKINNLDLINADIVDFDLNKSFDAAISLFHVISYITTNKELIDCFTNVNKHLNLNGIFLFDFWYTPAVFFLKPEIRIKRLSENSDKEIIRISEPFINYQTNIIDVHFEVLFKNIMNSKLDVIKEIHKMRHFSIPELDFLCNQTGFEILEYEEFLTGNKLSNNTWGASIILKKIINL